MKTAILPVVGEGLVAGVDDRPIELDPLINVVDDVIGSLGDLEKHGLIQSVLIEFERQRVGLSHAAGAGENLPGRQKRQQS